MAVDCTNASPSSSHDSRSAHEVTAALGIEPTRSCEVGETVSARSDLVRTHSLWTLESGLSEDGDDLGAHLKMLLSRVLPKRVEVLDLIAAGYYLRWFCFVSEDNGQGGMVLDPALMQELGQLPIALWLDIYATAHD